MDKVFISGATGNIGQETIKALFTLYDDIEVIAGVRNIQKAKAMFSEYDKLKYRQFDFEDKTTFENALEGIDTLFLLRPPQLSKIDTFVPLIESAKSKNINRIVFLSVQGADKSRIIPHNKIERLIKKHEIPYIFVRPSYFMQNLTTTLLNEIREHRSITLPSAKAKFNWVDITNIAECIAQLIHNFSEYQNQVLDITGSENESFGKVVDLINEQVDNKLVYKSVGPFKFYRLKKREGVKKGLIIVMLLLHYLPRFQKDPKITENVYKLTGKQPTTLKKFIERERHLLQ